MVKIDILNLQALAEQTFTKINVVLHQNIQNSEKHYQKKKKKSALSTVKLGILSYKQFPDTKAPEPIRSFPLKHSKKQPIKHTKTINQRPDPQTRNNEGNRSYEWPS